MDALRNDIWREAEEDRARDVSLQALLAVVAQQVQEEAGRDLEEAPWLWMERVVLMAGVVGSAWLARGGLVRLVRRVFNWRPRVDPSAPALELDV